MLLTARPPILDHDHGVRTKCRGKYLEVHAPLPILAPLYIALLPHISSALRVAVLFGHGLDVAFRMTSPRLWRRHLLQSVLRHHQRLLTSDSRDPCGLSVAATHSSLEATIFLHRCRIIIIDHDEARVHAIHHLTHQLAEQVEEEELIDNTASEPEEAAEPTLNSLLQSLKIQTQGHRAR